MMQNENKSASSIRQPQELSSIKDPMGLDHNPEKGLPSP